MDSVALAFWMNEEPTNSSSTKAPEKTGLTLFFLVGGFLLLLMVIGWLMVGTR
jgi:hypothetical protein